MSGSGNSIVDEDTARAVATGRETLGSMLSTAQTHLQKVFIVFVIGLIGTIYALRLWIWPMLKDVMRSQMTETLQQEVEIIATTPFEVILLQVKIGLIVGALISIPPLIYFGRNELRDRGLFPSKGTAKWKFVFVGLVALVLFVSGVAYGYFLFFPIMFNFLAANAFQAGIEPNYSIVMWTEFILFLSLSFGLAAELPLAMSALSYSGVVPYETFRDKWRYAVIGIFAFGALFSPPDPFTQIMWATPLLLLYGLSLGLSKFLVSARRGDPAASASAGAPADIDLDDLDASGVQAAPVEAFAELSEDEALQHAQTAMDEDDHEKAQLILDRFDEAETAEADDDVPLEEADEDEVVEAAADSLEGADADPSADDAGEAENVVQNTTAGMVNAFTEDETTEEDIGGWYYDITFILESLTSKMFRIVGVFMVVLAAVFMFLYRGGLGKIREDFLRRVPSAILTPEQVANETGIIALHPVEALVFEVKVATLLAAISVIPMILYYAWPAMEERGIVVGDRDAIFGWGLAIFVGIIVGSIIGYQYIAPNIISYLVYDVLQANMIISYRLNSFFWLVFLTTAGIGILADIPISMVMFERSNLVSYQTMREKWREVAIGVFAASALLTPDTVFTMFLVAIPTMLVYGLGLAIVWVLTLGGRR